VSVCSAKRPPVVGESIFFSIGQNGMTVAHSPPSTTPAGGTAAQGQRGSVVVFDTEDTKMAKDFAASADLKEAMIKAGVLDTPTIYFLESID
jgi:hypothetical protein